jgi:TolB protein
MKCQFCGKEHPDEAGFCPTTGKSLIGESVCPHCDQVHPPSAQFCPVTGKVLISTNNLGTPTQTTRKRPRHVFTTLLLIIIALLLMGGLTSMFFSQNTLSNFIPSFEDIIPIDSGATETTIAPTEVQNTETIIPTILVSTPTALLIPSRTPQIQPTLTLAPSTTADRPLGKIVYTCQIFKNNDQNQICVMNADGTNQRRLTTNDRANHFYPSLSPDGKSIVFSSSQTGVHEIYEMGLDGKQTQLTSLSGAYAPEISPDGLSIIFIRTGNAYPSIWIMNRNGANPQEVYRGDGVDIQDPTWAPNGEKILFAMGIGENKHLYTINADGTGLKIVNENFTTRGRSDWSWDGSQIAGYSGGSWQRKIYLMNSDGSNLIEIYSYGNVQAPSFSPNDNWVVFTGYIDNMRNDNGCEIYILRTNGEDLNRLTNNDFCDWQPRWGP